MSTMNSARRHDVSQDYDPVERVAARNALRLEAQLPLLEVSDAVAEEQHRDQVRAFKEAVERHQLDYDRIKEQIIHDMRDRYGSDWGKSAGGQWMIFYLTRPRFLKFLTERGNIVPKDRNIVPYGMS